MDTSGRRRRISLITNASTNLDACSGLVQAGLTEAQVEVIEQGLGDRYLVDRHGDYQAGLALMITAVDAIDPDTVLYVDVESVGLSLSCLRGECLQHQGCYTSVSGLLSAIRALG